MTVDVFEIGTTCLTQSAYNVISDLKQKGFYVKNLRSVVSFDEFYECINSCSREIVVLLNEKNYAKFIMLYGQEFSDFNSININGASLFPLCYGKNYYEGLSVLQSYKNSNKTTIYKLFDVKIQKLKNFSVINNVKCDIETDGLDSKISFDLSCFTEEKKWEFLKSFILEFNDYIYAETDISLEEQLVKILKIRKLKISTAESFTAGAISSLITSVSGASEVFYEGQVVYDENSKQRRLGVEKNTILLKRPVSSQTAYEMCKGLLLENVDLAIASTGLAGPNSDGSNLPVGLVFLGVGSASKIAVYKYKFSGSRKEITNKGTKTAIFLAIRALRDGSFDV